MEPTWEETGSDEYGNIFYTYDYGGDFETIMKVPKSLVKVIALEAKRRWLVSIRNKMAYVRTMMLIEPWSGFRRGQLSALKIATGDAGSSKPYRMWKKMFVREVSFDTK